MESAFPPSPEAAAGKEAGQGLQLACKISGPYINVLGALPNDVEMLYENAEDVPVKRHEEPQPGMGSLDSSLLFRYFRQLMTATLNKNSLNDHQQGRPAIKCMSVMGTHSIGRKSARSTCVLQVMMM